MKLAFIDCLSVSGGLSRYSLSLVNTLLRNCNNLEIDYYVHDSNLDKLKELLDFDRLKLIVLKSTRKKNKLVEILTFRLNILFNRNQTHNLFNELQNCLNGKYDVAFFPTAYMMERPSLDIPIVGAFHDFNWKYIFGVPIFDRKFVETMEIQNQAWLDKGVNICVSNFTLKEASIFFPNILGEVSAVPLGNPIFTQKLSVEFDHEILKRLNIDFPYIIFPANYYPHKNHLRLFSAFHKLVNLKGFSSIKLILTGGGTGHFSHSKAVAYGAMKSNSDDFNILGLGYQENYVIDALIRNAKLLVSASLYEAQCLPGMDAWSLGTPTAISDIPPFRESVMIYGVRTDFFNPFDVESIFNVLKSCLLEYERCLENGRYSKLQMSVFSDSIVADGYMTLFERAMKKYQLEK